MYCVLSSKAAQSVPKHYNCSVMRRTVQSWSESSAEKLCPKGNWRPWGTGAESSWTLFFICLGENFDAYANNFWTFCDEFLEIKQALFRQSQRCVQKMGLGWQRPPLKSDQPPQVSTYYPKLWLAICPGRGRTSVRASCLHFWVSVFLFVCNLQMEVQKNLAE